MPRAEGEPNKTKHLNTDIPTFSVGSFSTYWVSGSLNGNSAEFLADTGATVTLLKNEKWEGAKVRNQLESWGRQKLVGANRLPVTMYGCAEVELKADCKVFRHQAVITDITTWCHPGITFPGATARSA